MPVARIITTSPAASEELRRQLTAAGYSVKFAAPDEEFSDADIVVAAANVHIDYALQYASEVAAEADADVIVARGIAPGSWERAGAPPIAKPETVEEISSLRESERHDSAPPAAGVLFGTANDLKSALSQSRAGISETVEAYRARVADAWQSFKHKRELVAEQKRLEREHRELQRAEQLRVLQERRREAEAQMAAARERLRMQRQAEQEKLRREQEEMHRAMEQERARMVAVERERLSQQPVAPVAVTPVSQPVSRPATPHMRRPIARPHAASRHNANRDRRFQRAAVVASVVALVTMLGFAAAINIHPGAPIPHSMVQNPVQEQSPFGTARITPATTTSTANPVTPKPLAHTALPQHDATPSPKPPAAKPSPSRPRRAAANNYVAEDEVIVHHYGGVAQKHPPVAQTQAGVRKFSDQQ